VSPARSRIVDLTAPDDNRPRPTGAARRAAGPLTERGATSGSAPASPDRGDEARRSLGDRVGPDSAGSVRGLSPQGRAATRDLHSKLHHTLREIVIIAMIAMIMSFVVSHAVVRTFTVPSGSMEHTLEAGDRIWVALSARIERGDAVVFRDDLDWLHEPLKPATWYDSVLGFVGVSTTDRYSYLVKRLIGQPGDRVERRDGVLAVNGQVVDEPYVYLTPELPSIQADFDIIVPQGRVFLLGDHRNDSADSLHHLCREGPLEAFVPQSALVGPVAGVGPPVSRLGLVGRPHQWEAVPEAAQAAPIEAVITTACQ
jgi:signal peptidase I